MKKKQLDPSKNPITQIKKSCEAVHLEKHGQQRSGTALIAEFCGVTFRTARNWELGWALPYTEWTGETNYAEKLAAVSEYTQKEILSVPPVVSRSAKKDYEAVA